LSSLRRRDGPRIKYTADDAGPYDTIAIEKLTPIIGAEIDGIDLAQPLGNRQIDELHRALAENLVIFFRDQQLSEDQHLAFGRLFGELHIHPAAPSVAGKPELMIIHADKDSPRANGEGWHSDVSCDTAPPMGSILYIRKCPPYGGDTLFASMYAAYDALSDRMRAYLDGLTAEHSGDHYRGQYANYGIADQGGIPARRAYTSTWRTHSSNAGSAGRKTRSPFGTIAASSTTRCGTTGPTPARATGLRSGATARSRCYSFSNCCRACAAK